jgi:hypothetical protein
MMNSISRLGGILGNSSRKYISEFMNNANLIQRCSLYMVEHTDLVGRNCYNKFHSGPIFLGQLNSSLGAQNHSVILPQPIHAKNYIYALGVHDDEVLQNVNPLMAILIAEHICLVFFSPPSEQTIMVYFMIVMGRLCIAMNYDDMKECNALESKKTIVGFEFAKNIPNTTSWNCWASLTVT